uniref:GST N-terminal domain-containing protein n=1 Tax=Chromera velia CCMP2878 TaxID=1169474 RepID=A0A0G4HAA6_9ALVE|mmetsp:Transcript_21588/g.42912  ORF Transcript_21588/g.42912 Transcript_21588/m.42912 type:complete len:339 (-) Transcript_21588:876-1892(-)|eukprot:Cvel_25484.t1-p1 / transcript=Cvel_25484.t1 / gene=Cvel_25484 / organism=Chromera_velia_CCMP2878 / gene_product=hypothetical protein / transcript_product=hypothetical protein / location=Cvel_scaffold2894:15936-18074(-) / protein_length=338 / sequence_SO=supercontig / SO=protein_coding / is_pseudo=false
MSRGLPGPLVFGVECCYGKYWSDKRPRLCTITVSHYCEKVRWALDAGKIDYTEDAHPPGFHMSWAQKASPDGKTSTPLLKDAGTESKALQESTQILEYLAKQYPSRLGWLFPSDLSAEQQALKAELMEKLDQSLGVEIRAIIYSFCLLEPEGKGETLLAETLKKNTLWGEKIFMGLVMPKVWVLMRKAMQISEEKLAERLETLNSVVSRLDEVLSDGRKFLLGTDHPTVLDITAASLAYPLVTPPQMGEVSMSMECMQPVPRAVEFCEEYRKRPFGFWVLKMYKDYRGATVSLPLLKEFPPSAGEGQGEGEGVVGAPEPLGEEGGDAYKVQICWTGKK